MTNIKCPICGELIRYRSVMKIHAGSHGVYIDYYRNKSLAAMADILKYEFYNSQFTEWWRDNIRGKV